MGKKLKTSKGKAKKQAILQVAEELFFQKGYIETSVQNIIDKLSTSKGSFYYHFSTKIEVLELLCKSRANESLSNFESKPNETTYSIDKLNQLFYLANPVRKDEIDFFSMLLTAAIKEKENIIITKYCEAIEEVFLETFFEILIKAYEDELIFLYYPSWTAKVVLDLIANMWMNAVKIILKSKGRSEGFSPKIFIDIYLTYKFAIERIIDAPYGSIEILSTSEWIDSLKNIFDNTSS